MSEATFEGYSYVGHEFDPPENICRNCGISIQAWRAGGNAVFACKPAAGPVADDFAAINRRLKEIKDEASSIPLIKADEPGWIDYRNPEPVGFRVSDYLTDERKGWVE